jgi:type IV pilus assembly protein PilA
MGTRGQHGFAASGLVAVVAVIVLVSAVGFVLLAKRGGEEAASAASSDLAAAAEAQDRQAQSSLRNGLAAAKTAYTDSGSYAGATAEALGQIEPSLGFTTGASTDRNTVSVVVTDQSIGLASMSDTGTCFWIRDDVAAGSTTYGSGTACTGADALSGASGPLW